MNADLQEQRLGFVSTDTLRHNLRHYGISFDVSTQKDGLVQKVVEFCGMESDREKRDRKHQEEAKEQQKTQEPRLRPTKRAKITPSKKVSEMAAVTVAWDKCGVACKCPLVFFGLQRFKCCPVKGMKKCSICGEIKKSTCQKQLCKTARTVTPV